MPYRIVWLTHAGGRMRTGIVFESPEAARAYTLEASGRASGAVAHTVEETDAPATVVVDARGRVKPIAGAASVDTPGAAYFLSGRAQASADAHAPAPAVALEPKPSIGARDILRAAWRVAYFALCVVLAWKAARAMLLIALVAPVVALGMLTRAFGNPRNRMH